MRVGLVLLALAGEARAAAPGSTVSLDQPPPGPRPIEVHLALTIIDFARVNNREETFDMRGYLEVMWQDPRLARRPEAAAGDSGRPWVRHRAAPGLWTPRLSFVNAIEEVKVLSRSDVFSDAEGKVYQGLDFAGKFSTPLDLRRFPFDTQSLRISLQPVDVDKQEMVLIADAARCELLEGAFVSDWDLGTIRASARDFRYESDGAVYPSVAFETTIRRRYPFYLYRVLLPLTLLIVASWCIFWFDVTQLQPQISTALGVTLSIAVFNVSIDFGLPRAPHLTLLDRQAALSFAFAFLVISSVTWLHIVYRHRGQAAAERRQRLLRGLFPLAYVASLVLIYGSA
jgi:hypothetical protein